MKLNKWIAIGGAITAVLLAVMAFVHTPQGLAFYGRWQGAKPCPYGMDAAATPQARDAARAAEVAALRGVGRADSMHFLDFDLNHTERQQVDVWLAAKGAQCHTPRVASSDLECKLPGRDGASPVAGPSDTVFFTFDSRAILKSVHLMSHYHDAGAAAHAFAQLRDAASASCGARPQQVGEPSSAFLSAYVLRQVAAEFHLENVYARLSATHMPASYLVEQKYRALTD